MTIYLVQNDTNPLDVILDTDENLAGATVTFHLAQRYGDKVVEGACTVEDVATKAVRYTPGAYDFNTPGVYDAEFELSGGAIVGEVTVPNLGTAIVQIRPEVSQTLNLTVSPAVETDAAQSIILSQ